MCSSGRLKFGKLFLRLRLLPLGFSSRPVEAKRLRVDLLDSGSSDGSASFGRLPSNEYFDDLPGFQYYPPGNPVIQAEKCDKEGEYIRKWVPELADVEGKAVFSPHDRLSKDEFEKLGYPKPHVDFAETQQRAKERYKRDLANADP